MFIEYTKLILLINAGLGCLFWTLQLTAHPYFAAALFVGNLWIVLKITVIPLNHSQNIIMSLLVLLLISSTFYYAVTTSNTNVFDHGPFSTPVVTVMVLILLLSDLFKIAPKN